MKKLLLLVLFLAACGTVAQAEYGVVDDPTVVGTDGQVSPKPAVPIVLAEDVSMRQTEPTFTCTGRVLKTMAGRISLLEVKMDASRITTGAIKDQYGVVHTEAFSVNDYLVAFKAPQTSTVAITEEELTAECEAVALERGWTALLTASVQKMVDELSD